MKSNVQLKEIQSNQSNDLIDKVNNLIEILENDLNACDFKWTLFVAAATNYKYDSLLKPFPNAYITDKVLDINHLREIIANIPSFSILLKKLRIFCDQPYPDDCINDQNVDLLYWCLIREPTLKSIERSNVSILN